MKTKYILVVFVSALLLSCSSTKTKATPEQIQFLDDLVASQSFKIESEWAHPQSTRSMNILQNAGVFAPGNNSSQISLMGNPNFLKISGDSVQSYLPYYGEVQMVSDMNGNGSIELLNTVKDYEVSKAENQSYTIKFDARSKHEGFNVVIHLYPTLKSEIILNGTKRFPIRYTGQVSAISE